MMFLHFIIFLAYLCKNIILRHNLWYKIELKIIRKSHKKWTNFGTQNFHISSWFWNPPISQYPTFSNWLENEPGQNKCVQMTVRKSRKFDKSQRIESNIETGWETVSCQKGSIFLCTDNELFPDKYFEIWKKNFFSYHLAQTL